MVAIKEANVFIVQKDRTKLQEIITDISVDMVIYILVDNFVRLQ